MKNATHFNPVDLVVSTKISAERNSIFPIMSTRLRASFLLKSREGVEIKALELPGLWNGAMSDWNTILVEVPADTFNPGQDCKRPSP